MVKFLRLLDDQLFLEKNSVASKVTTGTLTDSLVIQVIPDIFLSLTEKNKSEPQINIILSAKTQQQIEGFARKTFRLLHINHWPSILAMVLKGSYLIDLAEGEQAFFYHDEQLTFFQRLKGSCSGKENEDLVAIRHYLKRYQIVIPENIKEIQPFMSWIMIVKLFWRVFYRDPQLPARTFQHTFMKQYQCYRHYFLMRASYMGAYAILGLFLIGQYSGYKQRIQEMGDLRQTIVSLSSTERKNAVLFDRFLKIQETHQPVVFDFAETIMNHWRNQVLITGIQWQLNETRYTIVFNPQYQQKIESFVDWIEGQPTSINLAEKNITNGILQIRVRN